MKKYYKNFTGNKMFWQPVKLFFFDKAPNITLLYENNIISNDKDVSETLNSFIKKLWIHLKLKKTRSREN